MEKTSSNRYRTKKGKVLIDLKLRKIEQLFDSRDPSPFLERDLDDTAADYIVSSSMEHPVNTAIGLVIHIAEPDGMLLPQTTIIEAIHNHFTYKADLMRKKLHRTVRQGQISLLIGFVVMFSCLTVSQSFPNGNVAIDVLREGIMIMGWVAMWRPLDNFLYSWWPQLEMRRVYLKLSQVPIEIHLEKSISLAS